MLSLYDDVGYFIGLFNNIDKRKSTLYAYESIFCKRASSINMVEGKACCDGTDVFYFAK